MKYEVYYEAVDLENDHIEFSVEYVYNGTRYAATGAAKNASDAYARIKEHRQEFRKELAAKKQDDRDSPVETVSQAVLQ